VRYKGKQVVELTCILDPVHFKTLLKEISLKLAFDKILYQQNVKCGNSSGKDKYMIGLHISMKSMDLIIVSILHIIPC